MADFEPIEKISVTDAEPSEKDMAVLSKYFDSSDHHTGGGKKPFPWINFATILIVVALLINPFTYRVVLAKLNENIFFGIQLVIIAAVSVYVLWF